MGGCAADGALGAGARPASPSPEVSVSQRSVELSTGFLDVRRLALSVAARHPVTGEAVDGSVRWRSRDPAVVVVDSLGVLTAIRPGRAQVVAEFLPTVDSLRARVAAVAVTVRPPGRASQLVAHRGFGGRYPENTLVALQRALADGAAAVEVDVRLTADGIPVLMHDETVDRTTDGRGAVGALDAAAVQALDACARAPGGWAPCPVPTLESALALADERNGRLLLDLKGRYSPSALAGLLALVREARMTGQVMIISFDAAQLRIVRRLEPAVAVGLLAWNRQSIQELRALGGAACLYSKELYARLGPSIRLHTALLREAGIDVGAWTIHTQSEEVEALRAGGARLLISSVPLAP